MGSSSGSRRRRATSSAAATPPSNSPVRVPRNIWRFLFVYVNVPLGEELIDVARVLGANLPIKAYIFFLSLSLWFGRCRGCDQVGPLLDDRDQRRTESAANRGKNNTNCQMNSAGWYSIRSGQLIHQLKKNPKLSGCAVVKFKVMLGSSTSRVSLNSYSPCLCLIIIRDIGSMY